MVVESANNMVIWGAVKHFSNLLEEALPIQLSCRRKSILSQQDVLALKCCTETKDKNRNEIAEVTY